MSTGGGLSRLFAECKGPPLVGLDEDAPTFLFYVVGLASLLISVRARSPTRAHDSSQRRTRTLVGMGVPRIHASMRASSVKSFPITRYLDCASGLDATAASRTTLTGPTYEEW